ncbi:MAG: hypothetical protein LBR28_02180 [Bacteroidales bacterium]|nr:hypothetical protein [Bacteroidales bacterium]
MHEEKGNNFIYHEFPLKGGKIPRDVISFDYDKEFIIVKQKLMPRVAGEKEINYKYRDSIFYYWLIE